MNLQSIEQALSRERLAPYLHKANGNLKKVLALYHCNMLLSEALYPTLHILEVTLRNNFETVLIAIYGTNWHNNVQLRATLKTSEVDQLDDAIRKLQAKAQRQGQPVSPITSGQVVAELHFGFWTSLLGNKYRGLFWGQHAQLFPNQNVYRPPKQQRDVLEKQVNALLNELRTLRNRVFHHEPIGFDSRLWKKYQNLYTLLKWMNADVANWLRSTQLDRFPAAYHAVIGLP